MTRLQKTGALILLLIGAAGVYAQEQQRLANILVLDRLALAGAVDLIFEGTTNDASETTLTAGEPTADRTITLPDATGTVMLASGATTAGVRAGVAYIASNPKSITTGLSALSACTVDRVSSSAPGLLESPPMFFSTILTAVAGRLDVYQWTTAGIASTNNGTEISYICTGTP